MAILQGIQGANSIPEKMFSGGDKFAPLPAGGYVCRVLNVKVEEGNKGAIFIKLRIDITEGEYAGFFQKRFNNDKDSPYGQKWKGTFKIFLPKMDGDNDKYINAVARYKGQVNMITRCNGRPEPNIEQGYDPVEAFMGCTIGVLFRDAFYQGNKFTESAFLIEPQRVRSGDFEIPEPRTSDGSTGANVYTPPAQPMGGSVYAAAASQHAFQQSQANTTFQQQSVFQQTAQNAPQSSQSVFQQPAQQTSAPAPTAAQNAILGNLEDFEEIIATGDVPF